MKNIFEQIISLIEKDPLNITVEYSNNNGKESLIINGDEVKLKEEETFDDSEIKNKISKYKEIVESLDDCMFFDILEDIKDSLDLNTFNELLEQPSYLEEEASILDNMIEYVYTVIHKHITNKIEDLEELLSQF